MCAGRWSMRPYWGLGSWDCYSQKIVKSVVKFWIHSVDRFLTKKRHLLLNWLSSRFARCSSNVVEMLWSPWKSWIGAHDHSTIYGRALGSRHSVEKTSKIENTQSHVVESVDTTYLHSRIGGLDSFQHALVWFRVKPRSIKWVGQLYVPQRLYDFSPQPE
jgi:hypothetical protein